MKVKKTAHVGTRITFPIMQVVAEEARIEGLSPSEWIRNLIVKELKQRKILPKAVTLPGMQTT